MEMAAREKGGDGPAHAVLRSHRDLIRWQTISERMSVGLKLLTGVAGLAVFAAIVALVWSASRYQGLVVQAFAVPPELTERGLTGEAAAGDLLDRLVSMQEQTSSVRAPGSYAIDWGDSTEVEIPQTGVSIGELQRWLRSWLGKETRISGVIYRTRDGRLAITARTGGTSGVTFTGGEDELEALMQKAAESVYARTQPYRFTVYMSSAGRRAETLPIYQSASRYGDIEAAWLIRGWGLEKRRVGDIHGALALFRVVEARAPDMGPLWQAIGDAEELLGHAEAAYQARLKAAELIARSKEVDPTIREGYAGSQSFGAAMMVADWDGALSAATSSRQIESADFMDNYIARHEVGRAAAEVAGGTVPAEPKTDELWEVAMGRLALARLALARGDAQTALAGVELADAAMAGLSSQSARRQTIGPPKVAGLLALGRAAEAKAVADTLPKDCYACVIAKGDAASAVGDARASDFWFGHAVRLAPSLPTAQQRWGEALLRQRRPDAAITQFRAAADKAPRWAEPLKGWGDALAVQGDRRAALARYKAAAERAPRWAGLHIAWGRALAVAGRPDEARAKWTAAAGMDLTPAERVAVVGLLRS